MRKTIKVDAIKKEIETLVKSAIDYHRNGNIGMYEYCYNKAIDYEHLLQVFAIDYSKPSYSKEFNEISEWFTEITNNAIYK